LDTYGITTGLVRDFAVAASPRYREILAETGPVVVRSLYLDDAAERTGDIVANAAHDSLLYYDRHYGDYPYRMLTVAETYFPGGMEWPNLAFIGAGMYNQQSIDRRTLDLVVSHEVAHQWWYGVVGDDQIDEPWLDEGLAQYSMYAFVQDEGINVRPRLDPQYDDTGLFYRSVPSYGGNDVAYNHQIYEHGAQALFQLRAAIGDELFDRVMQTYYGRWQYRIAHVDDFLRIAEEVGGGPALDAIARYTRRSP
jgi:aminopeptidase N